MKEIPYPASVIQIPPPGHQAWSRPLRSAEFPQLPRYLWACPTPDRASRRSFPFRVIPPLPTQSAGRNQASPGHAVLCPTMPPASTTDPPWCTLGTPSPFMGGVGSPGVRADRFAWLRQPRLRPSHLPPVLQIPPRGGHPTLAMARTQLDQQDLHLQENSTAGHTHEKQGIAICASLLNVSGRAYDVVDLTTSRLGISRE